MTGHAPTVTVMTTSPVDPGVVEPEAAPGEDPGVPEPPAPAADPDETEPAQNPS